MRTTAPLLALSAVGVWAVVGSNLIGHFLAVEAEAALRAGALALTILAGLARCASRVEKAMREHTKAMTEHVLTVERVFKMSGRADAQCETDARLATGTDSFRVYRGGR